MSISFQATNKKWMITRHRPRAGKLVEVAPTNMMFLIYVVMVQLAVVVQASMADNIIDLVDNLTSYQAVKTNNDEQVRLTSKYYLARQWVARGHVANPAVFHYVLLHLDLEKINNTLTRHENAIRHRLGVQPDGWRTPGVVQLRKHWRKLNNRSQNAIQELLNMDTMSDITSRRKRGVSGWLALIALAFTETQIVSLQTRTTKLDHKIDALVEDQAEIDEWLLKFQKGIIKVRNHDLLVEMITQYENLVKPLEESVHYLRRRQMPVCLVNKVDLDQIIDKVYGKDNVLNKNTAFSMPVLTLTENKTLTILLSMPKASKAYTLQFAKHARIAETTPTGLNIRQIEMDPFVALNNDKKWFFTLSSEELQACTHVPEHALYLCNHALEMSIEADNCPASVLRNDVQDVLRTCEISKRRYDAIHVANDTYMFNKPYEYRIHCNGQYLGNGIPSNTVVMKPGCDYQIGDHYRLNSPPNDTFHEGSVHWSDWFPITDLNITDAVEAALNESEDILAHMSKANDKLHADLLARTDSSMTHHVVNWIFTMFCSVGLCGLIYYLYKRRNSLKKKIKSSKAITSFTQGVHEIVSGVTEAAIAVTKLSETITTTHDIDVEKQGIPQGERSYQRGQGHHDELAPPYQDNWEEELQVKSAKNPDTVSVLESVWITPHDDEIEGSASNNDISTGDTD